MAQVFISYARRDEQDPRFGRFLEALMRGLSLQSVRLGDPGAVFKDGASTELGEQWSQVIGDGVLTSKVLVPIYSPSYFNSVWCGKEFDAFRRRANAHEVGSRSFMVPVLWRKPAEGVPKVLEPYQYANDDFPPVYQEKWLARLFADAAHASSVEQVMATLVDAIVAGVLDPQALPPGGDPRLLENAVNVFREDREWLSKRAAKGGPSRVNFVFLASDREEWRPYDGKMAGVIAQAAAADAGKIFRSLDWLSCDDLAGQLEGATKTNTPVVVMVDPSAVANGLSEAAALLDSHASLVNSRAVVPWFRRMHSDRQQLMGLLMNRFRTKFDQGWGVREALRAEAPEDDGSLRQEIQSSIQDAVNRIVERGVALRSAKGSPFDRLPGY